MDAQGHVNNAGFVDYLQEARADFLLASPVPHLLGGGVVVVSHQIEYLAPIEYGTEPVVVDVSVVEVRGAQFVLGYDIRHRGRVAARARTRLCPYDFTVEHPRRLTAEERAFFAGQVEPAERLRELRRYRVDDRAARWPLRVRWSDLDSYGHVNNVCFFDYVQEGRVAMSQAASSAMKRASGGVVETMWLVVRQDVEYRHQLGFRREPYTVRTGLASPGTSSLTFCSDLIDAGSGTVYATAATVVVCADRTGHPTPIPQEWKEALRPYQLG